jgi:CHASE2 domain-containing sensor protein
VGSGTYVGSPASGLLTTSRDYNQRRGNVATRDTERRGGIGGISLGGILVIIGIVLMLVWSFWIGLIIVLVGLIAFGGFARGKWY